MEIQHNQIIARAKKRGFKVTDVSDTLETLAAIIGNEEQSELFIKGTPLSLINLRSLNYFDNKQLTKVALEKLGIPHPKSVLFRNPKAEVVLNFFKEGKVYVCKPPNMAEGTGVVMNIKSLADIEDYWKRHQHLCETFLLEEQVSGDDLRVQVIGGKIIAACTREPAFVIGDGENDLNTLIEARRKIIKSQNLMNDLTIDKGTLDLLNLQNISLNDVPKKGQKIQLKELANMSQGAVAIDLTDKLHPIFQEWIGKIVDYLKVSYFAIDFIAKDYQDDPQDTAIVLEVNAQPEWLHHTFSEGRQHDIAGIVLEEVFG